MSQQSGTFGQGLALASRIAECCPRNLVHDDAQGIIDSPNFLREFLSGIGPALKEYGPSIPANNMEFELTLNGDEVDPIEMVRKDGYNNPEKWKFDGARFSAFLARRFKLVGIGYCRNFDKVLSKLSKHGEIPLGQWREAFEKKYRRPTPGDVIGIADASWVNPSGYRYFPCVHEDGEAWYSDFYRTDDDHFRAYWRWLVATSK